MYKEVPPPFVASGRLLTFNQNPVKGNGDALFFDDEDLATLLEEHCGIKRDDPHGTYYGRVKIVVKFEQAPTSYAQDSATRR